MPSELPKAYDPALIEEKWAEFWVREKIFSVPPSTSDARRFVMLLPPPNVTGRLHMGHMLNQTEMDVLTRWHRMRGEAATWVPGTDHAGIATQMMVERQLATEGRTRHDLGRDAFIDRVWQWKGQYGGAITDQMRRLGASVDWSREYFTMDDNLSSAVTEAFVRLYEQGLIYRGSYIVNWDPVQQTAVSDLEVEHKETAGRLFHIRYPFADGSGSIVIATTRPETILGDVAVAVNPSDARYRDAIGRLLRLPLSASAGNPDREIPILADDWAKPEFGTGAVKVTPAHDPNDFAIGQRHNLPSLTVLDESARVTLPGSPYDGLDRYEARDRIVEDLRALDLLVAVEDHAMSVATSQRSGAVIEPRLSLQWFLRIEPLAEKAIAAVEQGHIRFTPAMYAKTYFEWMRNIHDWCLSRQLWWGHRIPAYFCESCGNMQVARTQPQQCPQCNGQQWRQETDVLDTWFSSGLLPFTVFGWPGVSNNQDLQRLYPTDLLVTGFDILFFWVARMVMLGTHFMLDVPMPDGSARTLGDAVPFREVYIHALVRDADRQKMSKTKGNVIDPIQIIERFGTDAVRYTLASQASPGTDIAFSEPRTEGYRAFANKIWNAARFLFLQMERAREAGLVSDATQANLDLSSLPADTPLATRWIVDRLHAVCAEVDRALAAYRFDEAASAIYAYFWGEFCDWYLELSKLLLDFSPETSERETTTRSLAALVAIFEASLRLLSPFMPFLTEEIWHALYEGQPPARSIALTRYPQAAEFATDASAAAEMATLQDLITSVRALRKDAGVPEKESAPILLFADAGTLALAQNSADMLARMARVSTVQLADAPITSHTIRSASGFDIAVLYERTIDVAAERERLTKEIARLEKALDAAARQLGNDGFLAKAPAAVVEGLKRQQAENQDLLGKARASLAGLPAA